MNEQTGDNSTFDASETIRFTYCRPVGGIYHLLEAFLGAEKSLRNRSIFTELRPKKAPKPLSIGPPRSWIPLCIHLWRTAPQHYNRRQTSSAGAWAAQHLMAGNKRGLTVLGNMKFRERGRWPARGRKASPP